MIDWIEVKGKLVSKDSPAGLSDLHHYVSEWEVGAFIVLTTFHFKSCLMYFKYCS